MLERTRKMILLDKVNMLERTRKMILLDKVYMLERTRKMIMISFQKVVREKNVLMGSDLSTYKNGNIAGLSLSLFFFQI